MTDLETRLRGVDNVPTPDLWATALERATVERRPEQPPPPRGSRVLAALAALILAALATAALVWAFHGTHHTTPLGPRPNGPIATVERGPDGMLGVDNTDLVAIDPTTGATVHLTEGPQGDIDPVWSPDGTRVAFMRTVANFVGALHLHQYLFVMDADGRGLRRVSVCYGATVQPCAIREIAWSPDDVHLALVMETPSANAAATVRVLDTRTGSIRTICGVRRCDQALGFLAWSPDGTELAFAKDERGFSLPGGPLPGAVWVARADGSGLTKLTAGRSCIAAHAVCHYDWLPIWSPDGRRLAFLRDPSSTDGWDRPALVLVHPDGTGLRQYPLCNGQKYCQPSPPHWSPDGASIVLGTDVNQILRFDVTTGEVHAVRVAGGPECSGPSAPFWSPDGKLIAFQGGRGRTGNLCAVPRGGGQANLVVPDRGNAALAGYTWLPAGVVSFASASSQGTSPPAVPTGPLPEGKLVFVTSNGSTAEDQALDVWMLPAGGQPRQLTSDRIPDSSPTISPDGTRIAYAHDGGEPNTEIWVMNADGTNPTRLTDYRTGAVQPAWSPDGSQIAFLVSGDPWTPGGIYVMNADGSNQHLVFDGNAFSPTWIPDGSGITFGLNEPDGQHLRTVDLASGNVTSVLDLPGSEMNPVWSPDGSTLAFGWLTPSGAGIYLVNADGSHLRRVPGTQDAGGGLSWSPDGQWLAFVGTGDERGPQIYVTRMDGIGLRRVTDLPGFLPGTGIYAETSSPSWGS